MPTDVNARCAGLVRARGRVPSRQHGVALAILVWFIAAMSLLVAGIVMQARVDIKLAQQHASKARAEALADGAITLALAQANILEARGEFFARNQHLFEQSVGSHAVWVTLTPLAGLVDLNTAPEELLAQVLIGSKNIDENLARELAASVVEWRSPGGGDDEEETPVRNARFEAIEDLLLVPGFDRELFDAVRDTTYVSQQGQGTIDWLGAPVQVLQALGMNDEEATEYAQQRVGEDAVLAGLPDAIDPAYFGTEALPGYRADAVVTVDDTTFLRRRWVDRSRGGLDGLPWHFFRTEPVRAVQLADQFAPSVGAVMQEPFDAGN